MLSHMILLIDDTAASFCYYSNNNKKKGATIPSDVLFRAVDFAIRNRLKINCVVGERKIPDKHEKLLENIPHVKIVPFSLREAYPGAIVVMQDDDIRKSCDLADDAHRNIIVRIKKNQIGTLAGIIASLATKCRRLNCCLLDIGTYNDYDLENYCIQLKIISEALQAEYESGNFLELNVLTDRILCTSMKNCNAGIEHVTVAPDGKFYICPGFYYDSGDPAGDLTSGIDIRNGRLLEIDNAPICSACDAYHCKRCVYLNKKTTLELNTPSREQCVVSHLERETSRTALERLRHMTEFRDRVPITSKNYFDPFSLLTGAAQETGSAIHDDAGSRTVREVFHNSGCAPEQKAVLLKQGVILDGGKNRAMKNPEKKDRSSIMGKEVGEVTPEERDRIRELYERKAGLAELVKTITDIENEDSKKLYDAIVLEMGRTSMKFQEWWDEHSRKYRWENVAGGRWEIIFDTCKIIMKA